LVNRVGPPERDPLRCRQYSTAPRTDSTNWTWVRYLPTFEVQAVVSLANLVIAVRDGDVAQVMERTDLARVRHSLVDQLIDAYLAKLGQQRPVKPFERVAIMTPDNVSVILRTGKVRGTVERPLEEKWASRAKPA
jgi:hypothetical protein